MITNCRVSVQTLTLAEKVDVINKGEKGLKKKYKLQEFKIPATTL